MRIIVVALMLFTLYPLCHSAHKREKKVTLPFEDVIRSVTPFGVVSGSVEESGRVPVIRSVPLVMRILFEEAERVSNREDLSKGSGGDFQSLARSIQPIDIEELGLQRVILNFPALNKEDLVDGAEAWLVFQLRQSDNNCTQVLTVYENDNWAMKLVITVPLEYKTNDPLMVVNITDSLRQWKGGRLSYAVIIKDSTSYTRDERLYSFANYIDCSLAHADEVLELRDQQALPVLLVLSPELAAKNLLESQPQNRFRRRVDSAEFEHEAQENNSEEEVNCHLHDWAVNIEQLGWDWLVYPERIPLNLCVGTCPVILGRHYNATSHAVARGLYRLVLGKESKPENKAPCCVPVKYKRFTMLIEKSPSIISLETSSDLSAARCGCR